MKLSNDRGIAAEMAIGLLVCGAAYFFCVQPIAREAGAARDRAEALVAQGFGATGSSISGPTTGELRRSLRQIVVEARQMHDQGRDAFNETGMLTALTALADERNLQLEQLQPMKPRSNRDRPTPADPDAPMPPDDRETGYTLTLRGTYSDLASFLRSFSSRHPLTEVASLRVSAGTEPGGAPIVAVITTRHLSFDAYAAVRLADAAANLPE